MLLVRWVAAPHLGHSRETHPGKPRLYQVAGRVGLQTPPKTDDSYQGMTSGMP
jgi:hypothetical protein